MALHHVACPGGTCELLGVFGLFVQGLIGAWCAFTLVLLWRCEKSPRSFGTWLGDMSKQMVGAGWGHFMNVFLAMLLGSVMENSPDNNQCVWYLVGFLSDIIIVTFLCCWLTTRLRPHIRNACGIDIGDYEHSGAEISGSAKIDDVELLVNEQLQEAFPECHPRMPPWQMWALQTAMWIAIMTAVKVVVTVIVFLLQEYIYTGIALIFRATGLCHHQRRQLVASVIVIPVIGDAFQFAVQDSFLKKRQVDRHRDCSSEGDAGSYTSLELAKHQGARPARADSGGSSSTEADATSEGSDADGDSIFCR